jgi:hypothetical protein
MNLIERTMCRVGAPTEHPESVKPYSRPRAPFAGRTIYGSDSIGIGEPPDWSKDQDRVVRSAEGKLIEADSMENETMESRAEKEIRLLQALIDFAKRWAIDHPNQWRVFALKENRWTIEHSGPREQVARLRFEDLEKDARIVALTNPIGSIVSLAEARRCDPVPVFTEARCV